MHQKSLFGDRKWKKFSGEGHYKRSDFKRLHHLEAKFVIEGLRFTPISMDR